MTGRSYCIKGTTLMCLAAVSTTELVLMGLVSGRSTERRGEKPPPLAFTLSIIAWPFWATIILTAAGRYCLLGDRHTVGALLLTGLGFGYPNLEEPIGKGSLCFLRFNLYGQGNGTGKASDVAF